MIGELGQPAEGEMDVKIDKTDYFSLTNHPVTRAIPPPLSSRVVGCWGVVEKAVFDAKEPAEMDELEIFVFGRVVGGERNRRKCRQR
eukprot:scaffold29224_cov40-Cyclotella_meneghiniana.AAC.1